MPVARVCPKDVFKLILKFATASKPHINFSLWKTQNKYLVRYQNYSLWVRAAKNKFPISPPLQPRKLAQTLHVKFQKLITFTIKNFKNKTEKAKFIRKGKDKIWIKIWLRICMYKVYTRCFILKHCRRGIRLIKLSQRKNSFGKFYHTKSEYNAVT